MSPVIAEYVPCYLRRSLMHHHSILGPDNSVRQVPSSRYSSRHPLIPRQNRPSTPPIVTSFPEASPSDQVAEPGNGSAHTYSYGSVSRPYVTRGWIEKALPHGAKYFVNPRIQATADVELPQVARQEAVDIVYWSYADPLLGHPQPIPPPLSQDECQKLLRHLNGTSSPTFSYDDSIHLSCRSQHLVNYDAYTDDRSYSAWRWYVLLSLH